MVCNPKVPFKAAVGNPERRADLARNFEQTLRPPHLPPTVRVCAVAVM